MANNLSCLECGASGITEDLVYCASCRAHAVHRYCMVEWPKTKRGRVRWFCGCQEHDELSKFSIQSEFTAKVDELSNLSEFAAKDDELSNQSRERKSCESEQIGSEFTAKDEEVSNQSEEIKREKSSSETSPIQQQIRPESVKTKVANSSSGTNQIRQPIRQKFMKSFTNYGNLFGSGKHAEPIIRSIWTGCFQIRFMYNETAGRLVDGISAFLSNKADQKGWEETVRFGPVIRPEMVLKDLVWPKGFEETGPRDEDIAVYFFPSLGVDEQVYDCLVFEMMRDDLAMRVVLENAEILIFTSVDLIPRLRRFQGKWYLWGLLRTKHRRNDEHDSLSCPDLCSSC